MSIPSFALHSASHALQSSLRGSMARQPHKQRLIVAGATGVLGNEVMHRLAGSGRYLQTEVVASAPMSTGTASVGIALAGGNAIEDWPARPLTVHTAVVMFEPPRLYYGRERSLWTPQPDQLPALARWLKRCGVETLVIVLPHDSGRLPEALKRGLANLDELGVAALGFERLLLVRSARKPAAAMPGNVFERTAAFMLSTLAYMIPASEQPVRPAKLAQFIDAALRVLPPGTHVASPELLHRANQTSSNPQASLDAPGMPALVHSWLEAGQNDLVHLEPPGP